MAKRRARRTALDPQRLLFGKQLQFATDSTRRAAACCSRRAGKTFACAWKLLSAATSSPNSLCAYVARAREDARDIIWPALAELCERGGISAKFQRNTGDVLLPNGSKIVLRGASLRKELEKLRGLKLAAAVVDEAQCFGDELRYLLDDVIEPACLDLRAPIAVVGTPNASCSGPFFEIISGKVKGWATYRWTLLDNPHIPDPTGWLEDLRRRRGWDISHPTYRREYLGEWVRDEQSLVFALRDENVLDPPEAPDDVERILGIDLGFDEPSAFVIVAFSPSLRLSWVEKSWEESQLTSDDVAQRVRSIMASGVSRIVADTGGYGKGIVEELRRRHGLPVHAAEKRDKPSVVALLNADLAARRLLVPPRNETLLRQMRTIQWDDRALEHGRLEFDPRFDAHSVDALIYAWREAWHDRSWDDIPEALARPAVEAPRPAVEDEEPPLEAFRPKGIFAKLLDDDDPPGRIVDVWSDHFDRSL